MLVQDSNRRRAFQFHLWQLLWVTSTVALLLALFRLGVVLGSIVVFIGAELFVVIVGTTLIVNRQRDSRPIPMFLRGALGGSMLATLCFGWIFLIWAIARGELKFWVMLAAVTLLGGLLGLMIAGIVWCLRWRVA